MLKLHTSLLINRISASSLSSAINSTYNFSTLTGVTTDEFSKLLSQSTDTNFDFNPIHSCISLETIFSYPTNKVTHYIM